MQTAKFYVNDYGDRYLYEVNRSSFDRLGAESLFRRHFGQRLFAEDSLLIIVGTDSGALPRFVQRQGLPEGTRYLFLELDEVLPLVEQELVDDRLDPAIAITAHGNLASLLKTLRFSDYANLGSIQLLESIGCTDGFLPQYRTAVAQIRQQLGALLWAYNARLSNPAFIRRQLENLPDHQTPAECLRNSCRGRTAILLGGGPSLDLVLPWALTHREHLVIIAVSRICRRLREAGLTPHIVVSIDPTGLSFDISKEMLLLDPRVLFVHANHVSHHLLGQWPGPSVYLGNRYPWANRLEVANIDAKGPTVTNTGLALAVAMGFERVVLGGIDLCHSSEGYSHAQGSNEHAAGPRLGGTGMRVKTNTGRDAETTPDFYNAIGSFAAQASGARLQGISVVNPAPDAAAIEGIEYLPLQSLAVPSATFDPFALLQHHLPRTSSATRLRNYAEMRRELARAHQRLRRIKDLAEQALECNAGLFGRQGRTADFRHKQRMDKIERRLDKQLTDLSTIVRLFSSRNLLRMPPSDRDWTDAEIEQAGETYYSAYRDNAQQVLALVEQAQQRLDFAVAEESATPDIELLLTHWRQTGLPGRWRVWALRHPDTAARLQPIWRAQFDALQEEFDAILTERKTLHAQHVSAQTSLRPVRSRLQTLFREGNSAELDQLSQLLEARPEPEAAKLRLLASGYLAEMADQPELAFDHYARLIDTTQQQLSVDAEERVDPCLEDGLQRMALISLSHDWHDRALMILHTLSDIAPAFAPQYAELLRLSGDLHAALDVYTRHISRAPEDYTAMLRLGRLYQDIGATDSASTAYRYVLAKQPDNTTASTLLRQLGEPDRA